MSTVPFFITLHVQQLYKLSVKYCMYHSVCNASDILRYCYYSVHATFENLLKVSA